MHGPGPGIDAIASEVVDAAFAVHRALGPGMLESVYEACLCHELKLRGKRFVRQLSVPITYKDLRLDGGFRIDVLVENQVVVEIKAAEKHAPLFEAQLLTYLKLTHKPLGLLINFNVPRLKDGIRRFVI